MTALLIGLGIGIIIGIVFTLVFVICVLDGIDNNIKATK